MKTISVTLNDDLATRLDVAAAFNGTSPEEFARRALDEYVRPTTATERDARKVIGLFADIPEAIDEVERLAYERRRASTIRVPILE